MDAILDDASALETLQGVKFLQRLSPLLARLRGEACERDRAGNRELYYDQLGGLILLTFFNPSLKSLRDLAAASRLKQVRKKLDCRQASLGSLSEALRVFDSERLVEIIQELLGRIPAAPGADPRLAQLAQVPTAVDGSLLLKLPQVTQACFASRRDRGWKLHTHFEVLRGVPTAARVTDASGQGEASEKAVLRHTLESDRCYLLDRGYEEFSLFNAIVAAESSYVCRVRNDHHFTATDSRLLSEEAQAAGVLEDAVGRLGSPQSKRIEHPDHPQRRIVVRLAERPRRGGRRRRGGSEDIVLATNLLDVPAEVIALLYRFRWLIELFFRWLKCVLSCRHLVSRSTNGIEIQMYCALIACLLIQLAAGRDVRPNQWTYKLLCLYMQGWATEEEVLAHLEQRAAAAKNDA
jgi:Transposase DDE domain